ncbi:MAG: acyltransferase [Deltaproteobacteria bacterium]|nr:acyltransferase [Deltaproteobacteria bacterium]
MKIVMFQFSPAFGQVNENLETIGEALADQRADLVILPELCTTGYQFKDRAELAALAEPANGPAMKELSEIAAACHGHLVAGFAEESGSKCYNSAAFIGPAGTIGVYRKIHLFADEKRLFEPGNLGFKVFLAGQVKIGIMICFDWLFPESARSLTIAGAHIIAHTANLVLPYCQTAMITRALENHVFTATCNRIGVEERIAGQTLHFTGASRLVDPDGKILAEGSTDKTHVIVAEIDPGLATDKQITSENNILEDRQPDQYNLS